MGGFGRARGVLLFLLITLFLLINNSILLVTADAFKCSSGPNCNALIDYVPPNSTTLSAIQKLFGVKKFQSLLGANNFPISTPPDQNVNAKQTIKIPFSCRCANGTGVSYQRPLYTVVAGDGLDHIARDVFSELVTYQQIQEANNISNPDLIDVGQELRIPLPCSCDEVEGQKVVHYGHVVAAGSTVEGIAQEYHTTSTTLLNLNGLSTPNDLKANSVLQVPLTACKSMVANNSLDYPLLVANDTYVFTARGCVMCKCDAAANNSTLQCEPSNAKSSSCPSMQCQGSESLYIGNTTSSTSSCNHTTCAYAGYTNETAILTTLVVEPTCPVRGNSAAEFHLRGWSWNIILVVLAGLHLHLHHHQ